jgi:hypothetical protein
MSGPEGMTATGPSRYGCSGLLACWLTANRGTANRRLGLTTKGLTRPARDRRQAWGAGGQHPARGTRPVSKECVTNEQRRPARLLACTAESAMGQPPRAQDPSAPPR